jgi:hypothetical protein
VRGSSVVARFVNGEVVVVLGGSRDCRWTLVTAWLTVLEGVVAVWSLGVARVIVLGVVVAGVTAVVGSDATAMTRGSGQRRGGWGLGWGEVGRFGSEGCRSRGAGGRFEAGEGMVVVDVDGTVGGCVGVVSDDVTVLTWGFGLATCAVGAGWVLFSV